MGDVYETGERVTEGHRKGSSGDTTVRVTTHHDTLNSVADTRQSNPELRYVRHWE
jgi:hypothetical protein